VDAEAAMRAHRALLDTLLDAAITPGPTAVEEPTMSHDLTHETTPRGRQLIAALALAHLLELDLPAAEWRITEAGKLCGHIVHVKDSKAGSALHTYAGFFGAPVESRPDRNDRTSYVHLHIEATYRGAAVTVWTHVDVRPIARAVNGATR
jgi:hypothetical protein